MNGQGMLRTAACCALGLVAAAQGEVDRQQAELARNQRSLQQSRAEVERLLDLRLRHDLGLPADMSDRTFRPASPLTTEQVEKMNQELRDEDANTATLLERYEKLRAAVEQLRTDAAAKERSEQGRGTEVPAAGVAVPAGSGTRAKPSNHAPAPDAEAAKPEAPAAGERAPAPVPAASAPALPAGLDPLRAQIHGSTDHQRVAHALFKAGQALMDQAAHAAEQGQAAAAKELDDRGKDRLLRAIDELAPLLREKEPPFAALFCRGRCLELLFRHAERHDGLSPTGKSRDWQRREQEVRDPFLQIAARDLRKAGPRGESEVLGAWGKAAQSAIEHFRWMNLNAAYDATATIRALTWPGERDQ